MIHRLFFLAIAALPFSVSAMAGQVPANAIDEGEYLGGGKCSAGYKDNGKSCEKVLIPANASAIINGFACNPGYIRSFDVCVVQCKRDPSKCLRTFIKKKDFLSASYLYNSNQALFNTAKEARRRSSELSALANFLNLAFSERIARQRDELASMKFEATDPSSWGAVRSTILAARETVAEYEKHEILQNSENISPALTELSNQIRSATEMSVSQRRSAFLAYDHSSPELFFDIYPDGYEDDPVRRKKIVKNAETGLLPVIESMSAEDQLHLIDAWTSGKPHLFRKMYGLDLRTVVADSYHRKLIQELRIGKDFDLKGFLDALEDANAVNLLPSKAISSKLLLITLTTPGDFELEFVFNRSLPFKVVRELPKDLSSGSYDVVILLGATHVELSEKTVATRTINSRYVERTETRNNPAYSHAQASYRAAESAYYSATDSVSIASSNYQRAVSEMQSNQGFASGWNLTTAADELEQAKRRLNSAEAAMASAKRRLRESSPTITESIFQDYSFSVSTVDLEKRIEGIVALVLPSAEEATVKKIHLADRDNIEIAANVHPKDSGAARSYSTLSDLKREESSSFDIDVLEVASTIGSAEAESWPMEKLGDLVASVADSKHPTSGNAIELSQLANIETVKASHPAINGVVVVQTPNGDSGSGFFITDHLILTNYHVVTNSSFIEIELFDGRSATGKVVNTDIDRDLALVHTSLSGPPLELFKGNSLPLGESVIAIGHPSGLNFSLTKGIISAVREHASTTSVGLGGRFLFVQTDTAISPGNSGGPLLLNDKVIGINTQKLVDMQVEGIGFALHYTEIARFIALSVPSGT